LPKFDLSKIAKAINWRIAAAVLATVAVVATGVGVYSYQQYTESQQQLAADNATVAENALRVGQLKINEVTPIVDELEQIVRDAIQLEVASEGRTLDEEARGALADEIEIGKQTWVDQKNLLLELEAAVKALKELKDSTGLWASNASAYAKLVTDSAAADWSPASKQIEIIRESISSVELARAAWQVEQDRIAAAEAAARMARAKVQAPEDNVTDVSSPAPPPANAVPKTGPTFDAFLASYNEALAQGVSTRAFIDSFILSIAPNSIMFWDFVGLCDGRYICGQARPCPWGPAEGAEVKDGDRALMEVQVTTGCRQSERRMWILLDQRLEELYVTEPFGIGLFVLVHEAAHARQWFVYGNDIVSESEKLTADVPPSRRWPNGVTGTNAVEYMADCMTISYLGYSVAGSYTTSCTPEQMAVAASLW
jgi:hypothetical protein